jgi:creatinine amidohydrolase
VSTARKHALKDLTWVEFRERMAERPVILLPFASQEEQGPHAPMGDWMLTERLSILAAEGADAITAPTMPFGWADFFRAIPGGVALRPETFKSVLLDVSDNFLSHGLDHLVVFNGHSSNYPLIDQATRQIKRERGVFIPCLNIWQIGPPSFWREIHGDNAQAARGHGGDPLTSVYLHLMPELVRHDLIAARAAKTAFGMTPSGVNAASFADVSVNLPFDVTDVTANGIISGDPRLSSATIGKRICEFVVDATARFVRHWRSCDPRNPNAPPQDGRI